MDRVLGYFFVCTCSSSASEMLLSIRMWIKWQLLEHFNQGILLKQVVLKLCNNVNILLDYMTIVWTDGLSFHKVPTSIWIKLHPLPMQVLTLAQLAPGCHSQSVTQIWVSCLSLTQVSPVHTTHGCHWLVTVGTVKNRCKEDCNLLSEI